MNENDELKEQLAEVMKEIKKFKRESKENYQLLRISTLLAPLAVGVSIILFGLSLLAKLQTSALSIYTSAIPITVVGLILVILVGRVEEEARRQFRREWKKKPHLF